MSCNYLTSEYKKTVSSQQATLNKCSQFLDREKKKEKKNQLSWRLHAGTRQQQNTITGHHSNENRHMCILKNIQEKQTCVHFKENPRETQTKSFFKRHQSKCVFIILTFISILWLTYPPPLKYNQKETKIPFLIEVEF